MALRVRYRFDRGIGLYRLEYRSMRNSSNVHVVDHEAHRASDRRNSATGAAFVLPHDLSDGCNVVANLGLGPLTLRNRTRQVKKNGSSGRTRTYNPPVNSRTGLSSRYLAILLSTYRITQLPNL